MNDVKKVWTTDELVEVLRQRNAENAALRAELRRLRAEPKEPPDTSWVTTETITDGQNPWAWLAAVLGLAFAVGAVVMLVAS